MILIRIRVGVSWDELVAWQLTQENINPDDVQISSDKIAVWLIGFEGTRTDDALQVKLVWG